MEVYEKKHYFDAVLHLAKYLCWLVLGIAILRVGPDAFRRYPDWAWWCAVAMAVVFIIAPLPFLWVKINRFLDLYVNGKPAIIIDKDCVQVHSASGEYYTIYWNEVVDFQIAHNPKDRNVCYPVYKDDSRNNRGLGVAFQRDVFFCDHLTLSEEELLDELKKHINKV